MKFDLETQDPDIQKAWFWIYVYFCYSIQLYIQYFK